VIKYGCEGEDVKLMQEMLLKLGYDLGSWGCDGDFGDCTDLALRAFQKDTKLDVNGECGPATLVALEKAVDALDGVKPTGKTVRISGGNCYIRTAPNTDGKILGVAHKGDTLPFGGEVSDTGWLLVQHNNQNAWVSGKYGKLE
ncbi:MAG: peptidoglycan-binding protein, partial [Oscillospiraceae bacterium]|nr:peptidoglycan-binding protein [Oscillospiraceae bacterium]